MKIFVTRKIPKEGIDLLIKSGFEVDIFEKKEPIPREVLIERAKGADGLICLLTDKIDKEIIKRTGIKAIANYAVGYDNIDIQAATELEIPVTNTPGVLTDATADLTWALILATSRRIIEADKFIRDRRFKGWDPMLFLGGDFNNKTLGIIGMGRIGEAVARRALGFGMKIIYFSRTRKSDVEEKLNIKFVSLDTLLKESDYITIHCPYTTETHHLIDSKEFELMKHSCYLVNTARGKIINEKALIKALQEKRIMGVGLDVFYNEPEVTKELYSFPNVVLLPHIGSASIETRTKMAVMVAENIIESLKGNIPPNIINKEIYEEKRES